MKESPNTYIRIASITIDNFKSVVHGVLQLENTRTKSDANILGIYGQNGSGKTAVINALAVLQTLLSGASLSKTLCESINVSAQSAHLTFELSCYREGEDAPKRLATLWYEVEIGRGKEKAVSSALPFDSLTYTKPEVVTAILEEKLSISAPDGENPGFKKMPFIVRGKEETPFTPNTKYEEFIGSDKTSLVKLLAEKTLSDKECRSFVFSDVLHEEIAAKATKDSSSLGSFTAFLLRRLKDFGASELFIIDAAQSGFINLNALPLRINSPEIRFLLLPLEKPAKLPLNLVDQVKSVIASLNVVLSKIVPHLTIELRVTGEELDREGRKIVSVQLVSMKNAEAIPLQYESDGIKKIISILHLLISVYNQKSVVVAIDELDSGIFEYLLGELLRILSEHGQGELIFTSHNLRPLETINKHFIAFTTANPKNCYTQLKNVKETNNLRSLYFRNLILNADENSLLYQPTDNFDIARAFRLAGKPHD